MTHGGGDDDHLGMTIQLTDIHLLVTFHIRQDRLSAFPVFIFLNSVLEQRSDLSTAEMGGHTLFPVL